MPRDNAGDMYGVLALAKEHALRACARVVEHPERGTLNNEGTDTQGNSFTKIDQTADITRGNT